MSERGESVESFDGYLLDVACVRKYPPEELIERARRHTRACALEGHCVESGYAIISNSGVITLLDSAATTLVVRALLESEQLQGIKCRITRSNEAGNVPRTTDVEILY